MTKFEGLQKCGKCSEVASENRISIACCVLKILIFKKNDIFLDIETHDGKSMMSSGQIDYTSLFYFFVMF